MWRKITNIFLLLISFCLIILSVFIINIVYKGPHLDDIDFYKNSNIKFYDSANKKLNTDVFYKSYAKLSDINQNLINAVVSVEDEHFFSHNGFNIKRLISSFFKNLKSMSFQEGASTIDQQLLKNYCLSNEKTIERKIKEISLAISLENRYSKEQILEFYLNNILMGDNVYGVKDASLYYFNKDVSELSVDEAATLAGLIQLPNYYSPYKNIDEATKRRNIVLKRMYDCKYINKSTYEESINVNLNEKLNKSSIFSKENYYNSYLDFISQNEFKLNSNITLYMDSDIQKEMYKIAKDEYKILKDSNLKIAMVCIDNNTGGILGMLGNRDSNLRVINYATTPMQMASTMKPIMCYAPAFEFLNLQPASIISDLPYKYSTGEELKNWDYQYKGDISLRKALRESRNIPALKLYQMIDNNKRLSFVNKLNINPSYEMYESEALGAGMNRYSLLEVCNAYLAFANEGAFINATPIKQIKGSKNYIHNPSKTQVMKKTTAFFINSILNDVFKGSKYDLKNTTLMAKTGQSNYDTNTLKKYNIPVGSTKDSYVIAYTKSITFGVWVGYDKVSSNTYLDRYKTQIPREIMKIFMNKFAKSGEYLNIPNNIEIKNVEYINGDLYLSDRGYSEYFKKGYGPTKYYKELPYKEI